MTDMPYTPPSFKATAFNCPHCGAFAAQQWHQALHRVERGSVQFDGLFCAYCSHCSKLTIWYDGRLIDPVSSPAPQPKPDLPEHIAADFAEARSIITRSPRGAAALFRLCLQKLCAHLGESGKDLNADIAALVRRGLSPTIQRSLDIVRVIGNEAVHPGELDLRDDQETAVALAALVNLIVDNMITQPKSIDALYDKLPASKREAIDRRNGSKNES